MLFAGVNVVSLNSPPGAAGLSLSTLVEPAFASAMTAVALVVFAVYAVCAAMQIK